jgi:hypothetical protein
LAQDGKNLQSSIHARLDVGTELLGKGTNGVHKQELVRKSRLKYCRDMEIASDISPGPFHFTDNHYPESNGYECEIDDT